LGVLRVQARFIASKALKLKGCQPWLYKSQPSSVFLIAQVLVSSTLYVIIEHIPRPRRTTNIAEAETRRFIESWVPKRLEGKGRRRASTLFATANMILAMHRPQRICQTSHGVTVNRSEPLLIQFVPSTPEFRPEEGGLTSSKPTSLPSFSPQSFKATFRSQWLSSRYSRKFYASTNDEGRLDVATLNLSRVALYILAAICGTLAACVDVFSGPKAGKVSA
jgi:hypothetical protein